MSETGEREREREKYNNIFINSVLVPPTQMISYTDFMEISGHVSDKCR